MSFNSDDVNLLILRYLQESGFKHSSFSFHFEAQLEASGLLEISKDVKAGALIRTLQKGIQYMSLEAHLSEDGSERECSIPFSILTPHLHQCERSPKRAKREGPRRDEKKEKRAAKAEKEREKRKRDSEARPKSYDEDIEKADSAAHDAEEEMEMDVSAAAPAEAAIPESNKSNVEVDPNTTPIFSPEDTILVNGHEAAVFVCAWNPINSSELASGAGDATGRLWNISSDLPDGYEEETILRHHPVKEQVRDVTTLEWDPTGTLLATGAYDGQIRIWTSQLQTDPSSDTTPGALRHVLYAHSGPIFALKWNKAGTLLLSAGVDNSVFVWSTAKGALLQQFDVHSAGVLDIDWRDDTTFASCSSDQTISVCQVGSVAPLRVLAGHTDEVNVLRWDPTGTYLASCSDDGTAKVWRTNADDSCLHTFKHQRSVYTLRWSPDTNGSSQFILATASTDCTIKFWEVPSGRCIRTLTGHNDAVYSVAFSPNGKYLASGSFDQSVLLWNARTGKLLRKYHSSGGVFELSWNSTGDRVAAALSNNTVVVFHVSSNSSSSLHSSNHFEHPHSHKKT